MTMLLHPKKKGAQNRAAIDAASAPAANAHPTAAPKNEVAALKLNADPSAIVVVDARSAVVIASLAAETTTARVRVNLDANPGRAVDGSVAPAMKDVAVEMTVSVGVEVEVVEATRDVREAAIRRIRRVEMLRGGDRTVLLVRLGRMKSGRMHRIGMATDRWGMFFIVFQVWVALHGFEAFTIPRAP
jgi:hypothetical protein